MKKNNKEFWAVLYLVATFMSLALSPFSASSQLIDVKPWTGNYPDMEGSYPLTFVSFKDLLVPVPHVFVRTWPTHYYLEAVSLPITDATEIAEETKTGFLRLAERMIERAQMKDRHEETEGIKLNTGLQKEISQALFNARSYKLDDNYKLAEGFVKLYEKIGQFDKEPKTSGVKQAFEKEADELMTRFLMVNLMQTGHGEKLQTFSEIHAEQSKLMGEVDYTYQKVRFFNSFNSTGTSSYNFLTE